MCTRRTQPPLQGEDNSHTNQGKLPGRPERGAPDRRGALSAVGHMWQGGTHVPTSRTSVSVGS